MSSLSVLQAIPDHANLRQRLEERAAELRREGAEDYRVKTAQAELVLAFRLGINDVTLTGTQRRIASEQHECRTFRGSTEACETLVNGDHPCNAKCPIANARRESVARQVKNDHAFVTDWYMPESHEMADRAVVPASASSSSDDAACFPRNAAA